MKSFYVLLLIISTAGIAAESFPLSCLPVGVKDAALILALKEPGVVLVHNISNSDLWITHPVSDNNADAGWSSSRLQAENWSALVVSKESFELNCVESRPGHEQQVPCSGVIAVCNWSGIGLPDGKNAYWAGEDMTLSALTAHLSVNGFRLPKQS